MTEKKRRVSLKGHSTTFIRRIVQITTFLLINYVILETIFSINLIAFEGIVKVLPILNSPRNPYSEGAGIVEYIFYSIIEGEFPFLLIGILLIVLLFTGRFFCGWVCPIGAIQDAITALPPKKKMVKLETHKTLLNFKFLVIIGLIIIVVPLGVSRFTDLLFYFQYKQNLGAFGQKPVGYFSLSEYIFVFLPGKIEDMINTQGLGPMVTEPWALTLFVFWFYLIILILAVWYPRCYCRYVCPFGALAAVVSNYSFLKLYRNPARCVGRADCGVCERVCPKQIRILEEPFEFFNGGGECNLCLKCKEACPYDAISIKFG